MGPPFGRGASCFFDRFQFAWPKSAQSAIGRGLDLAFRCGVIRDVIRDVASEVSLRAFLIEPQGGSTQLAHAAPPACFVAKCVILFHGHAKPRHAVPAMVRPTKNGRCSLCLLTPNEERGKVLYWAKRCRQECPPLESDRGREAAVGGLSPPEAFPPDAFFSANRDLLLEKRFGELPPDRLRETGLPEHLLKRDASF